MQPATAEEAQASPLFQTRLSLASAEPWSPFPAGKEMSLARHFEYETLKAQKSETATLIEGLYSAEQRSAPLEIGFRGKPSIGAALFADTVDVEREPWAEIIRQITAYAAEGRQVRVFALGSVFGGTGAAGLPSIPPLLRQKIAQGKENIHLGGTLLLPYFSFSVPPKCEDAVYASPYLFALNSKEALRYYASTDTDFSRLYVVGAPRSAHQDGFALGGADQRNLPHFVELVGALGARDFYGRSNGPRQVAVLGVEDWQGSGGATSPTKARCSPGSATSPGSASSIHSRSTPAYGRSARGTYTAGARPGTNTCSSAALWSWRTVIASSSSKRLTNSPWASSAGCGICRGTTEGSRFDCSTETRSAR